MRLMNIVRLGLFLFFLYVVVKREVVAPTRTVLIFYLIFEALFLVEQLCCLLLCCLSPCFITGLVCVVMCCPRNIIDINPEIE